MKALILLQSQSNEVDNWDALVMGLISIALLVILSMSGRVQLGFEVPGFSTPLYRSRKKILSQYFPYYERLDEFDQKKFAQKVQSFIMSKRFYGRGGIVIDENMKVLIAACAVQLTFGFPKVMLSHFKKILVYPDDYYSTINNTFHKGEINPRLGVIVLSWKHFLDGYVNGTDGRNLGLHEMAHALHLENLIANKEFQFLDQSALQQWNELVHQELIKMKSSDSHFFRSYAATNEHEFFAIAVENFFERGEQFKEELPKLYHLLAVILRQD